MTDRFDWYESYKDALLETDWSTIHDKILVAESALRERKRVLALDHGGSPEERQAMEDALNGLRILRTQATERQAQTTRRYEHPD